MRRHRQTTQQKRWWKKSSNNKFSHKIKPHGNINKPKTWHLFANFYILFNFPFRIFFHEFVPFVYCFLFFLVFSHRQSFRGVFVYGKWIQVTKQMNSEPTFVGTKVKINIRKNLYDVFFVGPDIYCRRGKTRLPNIIDVDIGLNVTVYMYNLCKSLLFRYWKSEGIGNVRKHNNGKKKSKM